jgi:hypothetical protein
LKKGLQILCFQSHFWMIMHLTHKPEPRTKTNPPTPPKGGLTPRERANFSKEIDQIYAANHGRKLIHDEVVQAACARLVLPLEDARAAIAASVG